jgi:hypothetical protein
LKRSTKAWAVDTDDAAEVDIFNDRIGRNSDADERDVLGRRLENAVTVERRASIEKRYNILR